MQSSSWIWTREQLPHSDAQLFEVVRALGYEITRLRIAPAVGFAALEDAHHWATDLRTWAAASVDLQAMLWCHGFMTVPMLDVEQNPRAFIEAWHHFLMGIWEYVEPVAVAELEWLGQHVMTKH